MEKATKVLVVEDSRVINKILSESIQAQMQLEVVSVFTQAEAVATIAQFPNTFFVAILDLTLPDAPHGEVVEAVLSLNVRPIILTANMSNDLHDKMMAKPIIDYAVKRNLTEMQYVIDQVERLYQNFNRRILVVDDSKSARVVLRSLLERHNFTVIEADDPQKGLAIIKATSPFDLIITDFNMPIMNGASFITRVRAEYSRQEVGIIGISSVGDGQVSIQMLKAGANDFITRPFLNEEFYCRVNQNIDAIASYQKLQDQAYRDFLTGLYNRHYLFNQGKKRFAQAQRSCTGLAVAMMDIDFFKAINDNYGHQAGDEVLRHVTAQISDIFPEPHVASRVGGEEFCVVCVDQGIASTLGLFEQLRLTVMSESIEVGDQLIKVTISIGVTLSCEQSLEHAMMAADTLLYQAKNNGRNQLTYDCVKHTRD